MDKIELGDTVKEKVTGFKGIAVCRLSWIAGCDFIRIQPPVNKDGVVPDSRDFDEPLVDIVKKAKPKKIKKDVGGPEAFTSYKSKF